MKAKLLLAVFISILCCCNACKTQSETVTSKKPDETNVQTPKTENKTSVADNSKTSVDWPGLYSGNLPCADCEGIQTMIELNKDLTYTKNTKYTGKTRSINKSQGTFSWNNQGSIITLKENDGKNPVMYQVGENMLFQLDNNENKFPGALADHYKLVKLPEGLTEKFWKLTELNGKKIVVGATFNKEPHIILKNQETRVKGHGGCNSFFGTYELKPGNRITISQIGNTLMACPEMETETQFLKAIQAADSYFLKGDTLILHKAGMAPLARFEAVFLR
jgi:copper homeostasis protein (lipoprotein)